MDIHRCRFVPYCPQSINALSFSHSSDSKRLAPKDLRLAVGKANGDIEIWNPNKGNWYQERIFRGSYKRAIEQLAWTQDLYISENNAAKDILESGSLRLFTTGGSPSVTEWDIISGRPLRHAECNSGDIWCFAAQPQWKQSSKRAHVEAAPSQLLAAGCSNGNVVLFKTTDDDLQYDRILVQPPNKKSKVISITWRDRDTVVVGYDRSSIRIVDVRNRSIIRDMSLGKPLDGNHNLVWALKCLPDGTILSGDSSGELKIWDAKNFSLVQRLRAHEADILDIAISESGDTILTCGVDRRTVSYRPISNQMNAKNRRWQQIHHRRFHQHDVKSLATFESKQMSVAVSGGMDSAPVVLPLRNWDREHHRTLSHLPQRPQVSMSSLNRLMLSWWECELQVWPLPPQNPMEVADVLDTSNLGEVKPLVRLQLQNEENITSAAINSAGNLIVVSTLSSTRLFQIRKTTDGQHVGIRARQIELPNSLRSFGATSVGFSPDGKWLYAVRFSKLITLAKIETTTAAKDMPRLHVRIVKLDRSQDASVDGFGRSFSNYLQHISCLAFSSDSRILSVGDLSGRIDSWMLEGHENTDHLAPAGKVSSSDSDDSSSESDSEDETDSFVIHGQKWVKPANGGKLPRLDSAILSLTFKPSSDPASAPGKVDGNVGLHPTRHNPHPVSHEIPAANSAHLWAITANHSLIEMDVIASKLSGWSRRNPPDLLPQVFTQIKDRAMGTWWDCNSSRNFERLWLYGPTWIFMLDVSQDLSVTDMAQTRKSDKMGDHEVSTTSLQRHSSVDNTAEDRHVKKRKRNTWAGDEMRDSKKHSASVVAPKDKRMASPMSDDLDLQMEDDSRALIASRRQDNIASGGQITAGASKNTSSWHTFQYRSILGACCIERDGMRTSEDENIEVLIIERPLHDVDFVPRFAGGQDWDD